MMHIWMAAGIAFTLSAGMATADGKQAFLDANCNRCHAVSSHEIEATVESKSMLGPDLSSIGSERDAEWLDKFLLREMELDGKKHRMIFKGSDEERKAIVDWLVEQKASS